MVKAQKPISMQLSTFESIDEYAKDNNINNFSEATELLVIKGLKSKEMK